MKQNHCNLEGEEGSGENKGSAGGGDILCDPDFLQAARKIRQMIHLVVRGVSVEITNVVANSFE